MPIVEQLGDNRKEVFVHKYGYKPLPPLLTPFSSDIALLSG